MRPGREVLMSTDELAFTRRRMEAQAERARANAAYEADQCASLARGLSAVAGVDAGVPLAQAEKLAAASTALVRYLSALEAYQTALALLEDA
jgi:hypothetical protein